MANPIKKAAAAANLTNVTVVEGAPAATKLPDECCDAIFVRYVYHHFGDPPAMNASILRSLKPGGRFAVMDAGPRTVGTVPPSTRCACHDKLLPPDTVSLSEPRSSSAATPSVT